MERGAWTEERLDDLATSMREGFARVDQDMRDLRVEIAGLRGEINDLRSEFRAVMFRVGGGMIATMCIGFLSVLAAVLTRGA